MPTEDLPAALAATGLPVAGVLQSVGRALADCGAAVLAAPPGAGKTSLVPLSLLPARWRSGQKILLLLPRRLAARAAAERMAALLGEPVGERIGVRTRLDSRPGRCIECLTHGVFVQQLLHDPGLEGVGALLFDEVHERSLEGDFALALALDARALRPDLRLLAMSATLDGERLAALLAGAPVLRSEGRQYPLAIEYLGRPDDLAGGMARAILLGLRRQPGSVLAFLPGAGEIERVAERLTLPAGVTLHRLHGGVDPMAQRAALAPGGVKVVLATSIAETSLTIDGVTTVVDSGLVRRPRFHPASGLVRLETGRVSRATATQRAGRAARQGPGLALRLWEEAETRGLAPFEAPEILQADLAPMLLRLLSWGVRDPAALSWLDPPPSAAVDRARRQLQDLGALAADGLLSDSGRRMAALPVAPALACLLLAGARLGQVGVAASMAALLDERGRGAGSADLEERLRAMARDGGRRAGEVRRLAGRWAAQAARLQPAEKAAEKAAPASPALLLATAFPDRVAKRRRAPAASDRDVSYLLASGRGAVLSSSDPLARHEWLVVADAGGLGADSRIRLAAAFPDAEAAAFVAGRGTESEQLAPDPESGRLQRIALQHLGAIEVSRRVLPASADDVARALLEEARANPDGLPWPAAERALLARLSFAAAAGAAVPDGSAAWLLQTIDFWLPPRLRGARALSEADLAGVVQSLLSFAERTELDSVAPACFQSPAGPAPAIDYAAEGGPAVAVRAQALFGLSAQPMLARGAVPLTLVLLSPAGRPIARTRDLPAFWAAGWADVRRDMKGRYPRHPWPDDPAAARPTTRTKKADQHS